MNIRTVVSIFTVLAVVILGFDYYMNKKAEQKRLDAEAQIQAKKTSCCSNG